MSAPERFAQWMCGHCHVDPRFGHNYRYHPRSDAHSVILWEEILADLLEACPALRSAAQRRAVVYGINTQFTWKLTGKKKTLDLAIGIGLPAGVPAGEADSSAAIVRSPLSRVLIACEAKSVMTEHGKSQPRVFDELSSSHEIVHHGDPDAIAAGITIVNIAPTFVSPLRQVKRKVLEVSKHKQPEAAGKMIQHLRGLPIRERPGEVGFDAYATIVLECDNIGDATLFLEPPAPQLGDRDHYDTLVQRISRFYTERFSDF